MKISKLFFHCKLSMLICTSFSLILCGCYTGENNTEIEYKLKSDSLSQYKEALFNELSLSNIYQDSLLWMKSNIILLNSNNKQVNLKSLIHSPHTVIFRFDENSACSSCVNNEFIELKKLEDQGVIKLIIILDPLDLHQQQIVENRFKKDVYSFPTNSRLLPFEDKMSSPFLILYSNNKAEKFFILGPSSKMYSYIFNDFLKELPTYK